MSNNGGSNGGKSMYGKHGMHDPNEESQLEQGQINPGISGQSQQNFTNSTKQNMQKQGSNGDQPERKGQQPYHALSFQNYSSSVTAQIDQKPNTQNMGDSSRSHHTALGSSNNRVNFDQSMLAQANNPQGVAVMNISTNRDVSVMSLGRSVSDNGRDMWIPPEGTAESAGLTKDTQQQQRRLASDKAWKKFSIQVFRGAVRKKNITKFNEVDPTCFQFTLQEKFDEVKYNFLNKIKEVKFEVKEESLVGNANKMLDDESEDECFVDLKRDLIRWVINHCKCEKVSIPERYQEYVIPNMQNIRQLQYRSIVLLHCQDDEYKVVGSAIEVPGVVDSIRELVITAGEVMVSHQRQEEQMDTSDNSHVPSEVCRQEKIPLTGDEIKIVNQLIEISNVQVKTVTDGIEIYGKIPDVDHALKHINSKLQDVQTSREAVPENIWQFIWNHSSSMSIQLQRDNVRCVWSLPNSPYIDVKALTKNEIVKAMNIIKNSIKIDTLTEMVCKSSDMEKFLSDNTSEIKQERSGPGNNVQVIMFDELFKEFQKIKHEVEFIKPVPDPNKVPGKELKETTITQSIGRKGSDDSYKTPPTSPVMSTKTVNDEHPTEEENRIEITEQQKMYVDKYIKSKLQSFAEKNNTRLMIGFENQIVLRGSSDGVKCVAQEVYKILNDLGPVTEVISCTSSSVDRKKSCLKNDKECLISVKEQNSKILYAWLSKNIADVVIVSMAPVESAEADVIICPVGEDLLPIGVGCDIFTAGDAKALQAHSLSCKKTSGKGNGGFIGVVPSSGRLKCQHVGLAVWPQTTDVLIDKNAVQLLAENLSSVVLDTGCRTIAIPLHVTDLSVGPEIAKLIIEWFPATAKTVISHHVQLHFYTSSAEKCSLLTKNLGNALENAFPVDFTITTYSKPALVREQARSGRHVDVKIFEGSIDKIDDEVTELDAIVNSTTHTLDLNKGFVSKLLLKKAGDTIQRECGNSYPNGINFGDVAVTSAGRLKCKSIFHVALFGWFHDGDISTEILKLIMKKCLMEAEMRGYSKMAIPALGTGNLKYPTYLVARTMLTAVEDFRKECCPSKLSEVLIVLFPGDKDIIEAFKNVQSSMKSPAIPGKARLSGTMKYFPPRCCVRVNKALGIKFVLAEKEKYDLSFFNDARVIFNFAEALEIKKGWYTEENCYNFFITTDGSQNSIKDALKKSFEVFVSLKHPVVDVFPLSRELSSAVAGIQKQIELVIKIAIEKISEHMSSAKSASKSASQLPICYIKMVRIFISTQEFSEVTPGFCIKKPSYDYSTWQLYEYKNPSIQERLFSIEVFGRKSQVGSVLKDIKSTLTSSNRIDQMQSIGQWYVCFLQSNREEAIHPELNDKLNQGANDRQQFVNGILYDKEHQFDLCEMQITLNGQMKYNLRYDDTKDARRFTQNKHPLEKQNHSDSSNISKVPGKAVRQETAEGKAMKSSIEFEDEETDILTSVSCDVNPNYLKSAKKMVEKMDSSNKVVVSESGGKIHLKGSLEEVRKAEKLIKLIEAQVEEKKSRPEKDTDKSVKYEYEMSEDEYTALLYFSLSESWFQEIQKYRWKDGKMMLTSLLKFKDAILQCVKSKIDTMRIMGETDIVLGKTITEDYLKSICSDFDGEESFACFLSADKSRVLIKGENYQKAQEYKHKIEVKLGLKKVAGNRRGRVFASQEPDYSADKKPALDLSRSMSRGRPQLSQLSHTGFQGDKTKFTTEDGLIVFVYEGDILNLNVDCIVNAANEDLQHGGGVAFFISQAAGYELIQESNDITSREGPIRVGTSCSTTAGNLTHYHCVIHAVGPRWNDYGGSKGKFDCLSDLKKTVISAIEKAAEHNHTSIAIPAISSGIFGVPKEFCAQEYVRAVMEYSKQSHAKNSVKEVHFVDKDKRMADLVLKTFEDFVKANSSISRGSFHRSLSDGGNSSGKAPGLAEDNWKQSSQGEENVPQASRKEPSKQERILSNQFMFDISDKIKVTIKQGDISKSKTHVIVCPQDEKLQCYGRIAAAIHKSVYNVFDLYKDSNSYRLKYGNLKVCDVLPLKTDVVVFWNYVFHTVTPRWDISATRYPKLYETQLETSVYNILIETGNCRGVNSIAIPLIGVSLDEKKYPTPVKTCCECIVNGIMKYALPSTKKELHIELWGYDESVVSTFRDVLNQKLHDKVQAASTSIPRTSFSRSAKKRETEFTNNLNPSTYKDKHDMRVSSFSSNSFGKTLKDEQVGKDEKCCICMDYITNPKQLKCCGSKYCKPCIDLAFTHKQACPNCNKVYGKLEGNQPKNGTMTTYEDRYKDLPGYKGCGYIKINYFIPSGTQSEEHPNPGRRYDHMSRSAYVPNTEKGRLVVKLLGAAFKQRLVFTIGQSRTTGKDDVVTWNDIHHKTRIDGGQQNFGYPDPTYLDRVLEELAAKGITAESLKDKSY